MTSIKAPTSVLHELKREIQTYEQHVNKLRLAKAALQGTSASPAKRSRKDGGNRTALITEILQGASKSMNVNEIHAALVAQGRSDERRLVAAALPYLKRTGVAKTESRGQWVAVSTKTKVASVAAVAPEAKAA
jgi:hypothetical protein